MEAAAEVTSTPITPPPAPVPAESGGKNKLMIVAVIEGILIVLLLAAGAFGWYMYWQKSNSPVAIPVTSTTPPVPSDNTYQNPFDASQSALPAYQNPFATQ